MGTDFQVNRIMFGKNIAFLFYRFFCARFSSRGNCYRFAHASLHATYPRLCLFRKSWWEIDVIIFLKKRELNLLSKSFKNTFSEVENA